MTRKGWLGALATALLKVPQMRGLNMTLKPPRMTFFDCPSGLYEKPTRGPMLMGSSSKGSSGSRNGPKTKFWGSRRPSRLNRPAGASVLGSATNLEN